MMKSSLLAAIGLIAAMTAPAHANLIANGDFQTGDFTG